MRGARDDDFRSACREGHVMASGAKRHGRRLMDALRLNAHASWSRDPSPSYIHEFKSTFVFNDARNQEGNKSWPRCIEPGGLLVEGSLKRWTARLSVGLSVAGTDLATHCDISRRLFQLWLNGAASHCCTQQSIVEGGELSFRSIKAITCFIYIHDSHWINFHSFICFRLFVRSRSIALVTIVESLLTPPVNGGRVLTGKARVTQITKSYIDLFTALPMNDRTNKYLVYVFLCYIFISF